MATTLDQERLVCVIGYGIIIPFANILSAIIMFILSYQFVQSKQATQILSLQALGLLFFAIQIVYCLINGIGFLIEAASQKCIGNPHVLTAVSLLYILQYLIMLLLMFCRLKMVFHGTAFQLSQCTVLTFGSVYILSIATGIPVSMYYNSILSGARSALEIILVVVCVLSAVFNYLLLTGLYVNKLIAVNKQCDGARQSDKDRLIISITKISVLSLVSITSLSSFGILFVIFIFTGFVSSMQGYVVFNLCALFDVWINFVCILLSYQSFRNYYASLCGFCDLKCKKIFNQSVDQKVTKEVTDESGTNQSI